MAWEPVCTYARERLWDCKGNFRLKVLGILNSLLPSWVSWLENSPGIMILQHLSSGTTSPAEVTGLQARSLLAKRGGKKDSELWLVYNSVKSLLITSPSDRCKCKRFSGFGRVTGHLGLALFYYYFPFVCIPLDLGKPEGCAAQWGSFVHLDAVTGYSDFEVRIQVGAFC